MNRQDKDLSDAIQTLREGCSSVPKKLSLTWPALETIETIGTFDDLGSWPEWSEGELLGLSKKELLAELSSFRGLKWARMVIKWERLEDIPPIIVSTIEKCSMVADGRGRVSYAIGMGWKQIPTSFLIG